MYSASTDCLITLFFFFVAAATISPPLRPDEPSLLPPECLACMSTFHQVTSTRTNPRCSLIHSINHPPVKHPHANRKKWTMSRQRVPAVFMSALQSGKRCRSICSMASKRLPQLKKYVGIFDKKHALLRRPRSLLLFFSPLDPEKVFEIAAPCRKNVCGEFFREGDSKAFDRFVTLKKKNRAQKITYLVSYSESDEF